MKRFITKRVFKGDYIKTCDTYSVFNEITGEKVSHQLTKKEADKYCRELNEIYSNPEICKKYGIEY